MMPPIVFAAAPIILILATLLMKRFRLWVVAFSITAFVISMPSTGINFAAFTQHSPPSKISAQVHVVQMNTDFWAQQREGSLTDPRNKHAMLNFLRSLDADIYLLQEHMRPKGNQAIPLTDLSDVAEKFPEYQAITAGTLLTLTRLPVVDHTVVNPKNQYSLRLPPPPYALKVNVQVGDQILSTYNVYMPIQILLEKQWLSSEFYDEIRTRYFVRKDEFHHITQDVARNDLPLVIAGDFNTSPAMGDNRSLLNITTDAASFSKALYPATWRVGGQLPKLWRTDWLLIRNNVTVSQFQSLDPKGNSDHLVQSVTLSLYEKD
ncbi:endonuclease/exonuclease/phosphatase family protein [Pseudovibrio axinellae]|nr:endonuclease/exonuclease/phosphatase family protein [Pseudovibrio axinellae]